jgi:hypothetical protein
MKAALKPPVAVGGTAETGSRDRGEKGAFIAERRDLWDGM